MKYSYLIDCVAQIAGTIVETEPSGYWDLYMIRIPHHNSPELIKATQQQPCRGEGKTETWRPMG